MKKTYVKPMVSFEGFAFSSNIAGSCGDIIGMHTSNSCPVYGTHSGSGTVTTCVFYDGFFTIFAEGNTMCQMGPEDSLLGNLCYDIPNDSTRMFMS